MVIIFVLWWIDQKLVDGSFHLEFLRLGGHGGSAGAGAGGDGVFVADEGLGVEFEGFAHEFRDAVTKISQSRYFVGRNVRDGLTPIRRHHRAFDPTIERRSS